MSNAQQLSEIIQGAGRSDYGINGRPLLIAGDSAPGNTADVGWVYMRTAVGTTGLQRLYVWNDLTKAWQAVTGVT